MSKVSLDQPDIGDGKAALASAFGGTEGGETSLMDILDCGLILLDGQQRILFWNDWLTRRSGKGPAEVLGKTLQDIFGDQLSQTLRAAIADACTLGMSAVLSNQLHRHLLPLKRSGRGGETVLEQSASVRPITKAMVLTGAAEISGTRCVVQITDVSSAVRREKHLRETQAQIRLRNRALEASSQGIIIVDALAEDRPIIYANTAFSLITGYSADEVIGRNCRFLQGEEVEQPGLDTIRHAIREEREAIAVLRNYRKDGTPFWNELLISPVFDSSGKVTNFVGVQRDITARRQIEEQRDRANAELREANDRLSREEHFTASVLKTIGALVAVVDRRGRIMSFNRACQETTGLSEQEVLGTRLSDLIPDPSAARSFRLDQGSARVAQSLRTELNTRSGEHRIIRWNFSQLQSGEGVASHLICTGIDITDRERAYGLLEAERSILELVARAEPLDSLLSRLCELIEGQMPGSIASINMLDDVGQHFVRSIGPSVHPDFAKAMSGLPIGPNMGTCGAAAFYGRPQFTYDTLGDENWRGFRELAERLELRSCWSIPVLSSAQLVLGTFVVQGHEPRLPDQNGTEVMARAAKIAAIAIERHQAEQRIQHLALYDQLTGLANRVLLSDRLQAALRSADRHKQECALFFIDLDGFKPINDAHGHDAGDAVLESIGRRLQGVLRNTDTAARIGGDEFVVLAEGVQGQDDAALIADKVMAALSQPVQWQEKHLTVGASIGVALYPDHASDSDTLLTVADNAMYMVKQQGKNKWMMASNA